MTRHYLRTGSVKLAAITLAAQCLAAGHASAQALPASPTARPTKIEPIAKSMTQLLDQGYEITSMSSGMAGFGFVLRRKQSWIFCSISTTGQPPNAKPVSDCGSLNDR